jgi:hypothetical protein
MQWLQLVLIDKSDMYVMQTHIPLTNQFNYNKLLKNFGRVPLNMFCVFFYFHKKDRTSDS